MTTKSAAPGAEAFLPARRSLAAMRAAVQECRGCHLYRHATQAVFGEGPRHASLVMVGEQPGTEEDLQGHPFVGPAGKLLDGALAAIGADRNAIYITNTVKHFKWRLVGKRRKHEKPDPDEVAACDAWVHAELALIRPKVLVCLGATAAQALLGKGFRVTRQRGTVLETPLAEHAVATIHPSAILRQRTSADRHRELARFEADLRVAFGLLT